MEISDRRYQEFVASMANSAGPSGLRVLPSARKPARTQARRIASRVCRSDPSISMPIWRAAGQPGPGRQRNPPRRSGPWRSSGRCSPRSGLWPTSRHAATFRPPAPDSSPAARPARHESPASGLQRPAPRAPGGGDADPVHRVRGYTTISSWRARCRRRARSTNGRTAAPGSRGLRARHASAARSTKSHRARSAADLSGRPAVQRQIRARRSLREGPAWSRADGSVAHGLYGVRSPASVKVNPHDVEPVIQVGEKCAGFNEGEERLGGRGDDLHLPRPSNWSNHRSSCACCFTSSLATSTAPTFPSTAAALPRPVVGLYCWSGSRRCGSIAASIVARGGRRSPPTGDCDVPG